MSITESITESITDQAIQVIPEAELDEFYQISQRNGNAMKLAQLKASLLEESKPETVAAENDPPDSLLDSAVTIPSINCKVRLSDMISGPPWAAVVLHRRNGELVAIL